MHEDRIVKFIKKNGYRIMPIFIVNLTLGSIKDNASYKNIFEELKGFEQDILVVFTHIE